MNAARLPAGFAEGLEGPVEVTRWCPGCREFVLANDRTDGCCWCDTPTVPAALAGPRRRETAMSIVDERPRTGRPRNGSTANRVGGGITEQARELVKLARQLDKARARLAAVSPENAQQELEEAIRLVQAQPTSVHLARLEQASKQARRGSPRREKATTAADQAERAFKTRLAAIAALVR